MDIDDNDAQDQNLLLVGEGSSKVSPVLRSYALPKFDFDDSLQGHLRFDSLVENEVFLGITSQEDNHWIEEYSRGTGAIQFSSSAVESTRKNVWSEATSSESVEMLLKSVGQEERVVEDTIIEELDACDKPGGLTHVMNSNFQEDFLGSEVNSDCKQSHATPTSQSHETQISGGTLESVVVSEKYNSSVDEETIDKICDDVNQEASKMATESFVNELQEDPFLSKVESENAGPLVNIDASAVESTKENMLSEATFSESTEMLLSSVGQEERVVEETLIEESDACDRPGSLNSVMDPSFQENIVESNVNDDCKQSRATFKSQSQDTQISGETLELPIRHDGEETINNICDDVKQEAIKMATESFVDELHEDSSVSKVECGNAGSSQNVDASDEEDLQEVSEKCIENASGMSKNIDSNYMIRSKEDSIDNLANSSTITDGELEKNVEYVDPTVPLPMGSCDMQIDEGSVKEPNDNMQEESLAASPINGCVEKEAIEDVITKSETPDSPKSNVGSPCSPFRVQIHCFEETENVVENDGHQVTSGTSLVSLGNNQEMCKLPDINNDGKTLIGTGSSAEIPAEDISDKDGTALSNAPKVHHTGDSSDEDQSSPARTSGLVQVGDETLSSDLNAQVGDETRSSEPNATINQDVTFNEGRDARLPLDFRNMDMDVVGATENQKNVEPSLFAEGVIPMAQAESNMVVLTNAVATVESSKMLSPDTLDKVQLPSGTVATAAAVTEDQPRSPILGVSLLHDNDEEKIGLSIEGSSDEGIPEADSTAGRALDAPSPVVENDTLFGGAEKAVFGLADHCDPPVENCITSPSEQTAVDSPAGLKGSKTLETRPLPCYSSAEGGDNADESMAGDGVEPINLAVNVSDGQQASVDVPDPSECNTNHVLLNEDGSASMDKPQTSSLSDTKSIGLSHSAKDKHEVTKGSTNENAPLSKVSDDGEGFQSPSSSGATKEEKSFTFDVSANAGQSLSLSKNMVPSVSSSGSQLDPVKLHEDSLVSPKLPVPSIAAAEAGAKGNLERKSRRKSVGRETSKKGNHSKETTPVRRSKQVEKSSPLLTPPATGHASPVEESKPSDSIECSNPKSGGLPPISTSKLPDLNNSTSIFQHSFTDNQQVQLRAQILVYGSLLSGMPPEEPHMIAAFGQSGLTDGGRRAWEAVWHACLERVRCQKSQANNPVTPTPSRSGKRDPDQGIKIGSAQSKVLSGFSSPIVSPLIPISSPLWNIPTPSDVSQSSAMPRSPLLSHRQTISPLHPYQTPPMQNFAGHNPSWLSQGRFPGQWVASSPIAPFSARFSALPITESVKLTTVKESGAPGTPVDPSTGPGVYTVQPSNDSKSRKRKKVAASGSPHTEGQNQISFLAENQRNIGTAPVVSSHSPKSAVLQTLVPINSKNSPIIGEQNIEKVVTSKEILSKIEESKLQAGDAAVHAAAAVSHCQDVWSQLERQTNSGLVSNDEAKLASSAVSIAAASSVAKVAAAAAKIAFNVAEQARLMADEVFLSNKTESHGQSTMISQDNAASIISAAREAARRRIEAASAASRHAENLDAIVKAAELAAEAVSQTGKIVALSNPLPLRELVAAGPENYWKTLQSSNEQAHSDKKSVEATPNEKVDSGNLAKKQKMIIDGISGSVTSFGNDKTTAKGHKGPKLSKTVGISPESVSGSVHTSDVDQNVPQSTSGTWKENIKEGCLVEVRKDNIKKKAAWFAANVLTLKDGKAFVCYTEIQSDEGSEKLKEWVPLEVEGTEAPRIRIAHPMTTMRSEGTRKRGRTALTDYSWSGGDQVDVWVQDCWCEAVVVEANKIDVTSLTVQFPAQGDTSVVRSWHVRPALIWKDGKWIEWSSLKGSHSPEGDTPHEKRQKFDSSVVEGTEKDKLSSSVDLVESGKHQDLMTLPLSSQGSTFNVGKSSKNENKLDTRRTMKSSLQKEQSRVVFGVPKPGKKQKFMDVSMHYVADRSNKNNTPNDPVKLTSYLMPQASAPRGSKSYSKNDAKEKQAAEVKSKVVKSRKPPVPTVKMLAQKEKLKPSKPTSPDAFMSDENLSGHQIPENAKETSTSKAVFQHLNRGKAAPADWKATKVEVKEKSTSEIEPRRSNRRIQPTSRLLEGLQSSLSVSKMPVVSHASQKSYNKVTPKGSTNSS